MEEFSFKLQVFCPRCKEMHTIEYEYKGVGIIPCPKVPKNTILAYDIEPKVIKEIVLSEAWNTRAADGEE